MTPFYSWEWIDGYDDVRVATSPEGLFWSADLAYYAGKPSLPSCHQSFAEFLRDGVPDGYGSIPPQKLEALREAVTLVMALKPPAALE
ncbi:hypothetical protein BH11PSE11_BH11PSE11_19190 [soil metagenome]